MRQSKILNKQNTVRNFARKGIKEFEQFKNHLIQKRLLKGTHELIGESYS